MLTNHEDPVCALQLLQRGSDVVLFHEAKLVDSAVNHEALETTNSLADHRTQFASVAGNDASQKPTSTKHCPRAWSIFLRNASTDVVDGIEFLQ